MSLVVFLTIIGLIQPLANRLRLPLTVVLALIGILLGAGATFLLETPLTDAFNYLALVILDLPIGSEVFLYVFLPTLLFQAALALEVCGLLDDWVPILVLAVFAVAIATFVIWRAVDHEGEVLEAFVSKTRGKKAALKFLRKLMKRHGQADELVTKGLKSYGAGLKEIGAEDHQVTGRRENNRAENSNQQFRRRERAMLRFRRMHILQKFAFVHGSVHNQFNADRSLTSRDHYKGRSHRRPRRVAPALCGLTRGAPARTETSSYSSDSSWAVCSDGTGFSAAMTLPATSVVTWSAKRVV